jgi:hypothetical protein
MRQPVALVSDLLHIFMLIAEYSCAICIFVRTYQAHKIATPWAGTKGFYQLVFEQGMSRPFSGECTADVYLGAMYFSIISVVDMASVVLNFVSETCYLLTLLIF